MARASSGLAYPERFYAASSYAGFDGSPTSSGKGASSKFPNDVAVLLYALYQQGLSLVLSSYNGEDILVSFGGYNGQYSNEVHGFKLSNKSTLESKMMEPTIPDRVSAVNNATNATNATRDVESEFEAGQEGKIREIVMDNIDSHPKIKKFEETSEHLIAALKAEKEELESSFNKEKLQALQLEQELTEAESCNTDLYKELQSVHGQLAAEQSRCFKLEVDIAELRQKLQTMETLRKELELLQRQKKLPGVQNKSKVRVACGDG